MSEPRKPTPEEERFVDGYLAGCAIGNGYMELIDAELAQLRRDNERLKYHNFDLRKQLASAEAQALLLANENASLVARLRQSIKDCLRLA